MDLGSDSRYNIDNSFLYTKNIRRYIQSSLTKNQSELLMFNKKFNDGYEIYEHPKGSILRFLEEISISIDIPWSKLCCNCTIQLENLKQEENESLIVYIRRAIAMIKVIKGFEKTLDDFAMTKYEHEAWGTKLIFGIYNKNLRNQLNDKYKLDTTNLHGNLPFLFLPLTKDIIYMDQNLDKYHERNRLYCQILDRSSSKSKSIKNKDKTHF